MQLSSSPYTLSRTAVIRTLLSFGLKYGGIGGAVLGAIFGTLVVPFFGTWVGLIIGGLVGLATGIANALVLGFVSVLLFYPLRSSRLYTLTIPSLSMYLTLVVALVGFAYADSDGDRLIVPRIVSVQAFGLVQLPSLIACIFAWFIAQRITHWYLQEAPVAPMLRHTWYQHVGLIVCGVIVLTAPLAWLYHEAQALIFRARPGDEVIVFARGTYLMGVNLDGTLPRRLTYHFNTSLLNNSVSANNPERAPLGAGIVYRSTHTGLEQDPYNGDQYQLRLDGSPSQLLDVDDPAVLAPDGQKYAYTSAIVEMPDGGIGTGTASLRVRTAGSEQIWCITCDMGEVKYPADPVWSPDSRQIVFNMRINTSLQLFVADWDGRNVRQLTVEPNTDDTEADWSPDGQSIVFVRKYDDGSRSIMLMRSDGMEVRQLTFRGSDHDPSWSPDGTHIVFSSAIGGDAPYARVGSTQRQHIFVMKADGSQRRRITFGATNNNNPIWVRVPSAQ